MKHLLRLPLFVLLAVFAGRATDSRAAISVLTNAILFVTQVPMPREANGNAVSNSVLSVVSLFGNHLADTASAGRGGDLWLRLTNGALVNLTRGAQYGVAGAQHTNGIAVRDPHIHWGGNKAVFSMVVGAPKTPNDLTKFYWQLYEVMNLTNLIANPNLTPVIVPVAGQSTNANNVSPCYATDDHIVFMSDLPPNGQWQLAPLLDEYKGRPSLSGTWNLDPVGGNLRLIQHTPSGVFNPFVDSFGRLIVTRWDHLVQDGNFTDDRLGRSTNGSFNFSSEASNAVPLVAPLESFPEPRNFDSNGLAMTKTRGNAFNRNIPWELSQNGGREEIINHWGQQEFNQAVTISFTNDANLLPINNPSERAAKGVLTVNTNSFNNFFQIAEDPRNPGTYFGVDAPDFSSAGGTHTAGQIISILGPPSVNPTQMMVNLVTPPTAAPGVFRNPLPMSDGKLVSAFTPVPGAIVDSNLGSPAAPVAFYQFRLMTLTNTGSLWTTNQFLTTGLSNSASYYDGATLVTHSGVFWELQPVEVRPRHVPTPVLPTVAPIEQQAFAAENIDLPTFQADLVQRNMALVISRNVTARDAADKQQPYNLNIPGGTNTIGTSGRIYDITHLQFLQADYLRGYTYGTANIQPGRRVLAAPLHDTASFNRPSAKTNAPLGGAELMPDGSQAAFVPAARAVTWQLTGVTNESIVKERYWITFSPGEVRTCANCHGINAKDQIGRPSPTNSPFALHELLKLWRTNAANAYSLVVSNGTGSGSFGAGSIMALSANPPPPGKLFAGWTGASVSNSAAPATLFIMPTTNALVSATYTNIPTFNLTVNNGSGSGAYTQGTIVSITATTPPPSQVFAQWTGATVASPLASTTTLTMPGGDSTVTATFQVLVPQLGGNGGVIKFANGAFQFSATGAWNQAYTVMANTNLNSTNWFSIGTGTTDMGGVLYFTDPAATNAPQKFYRLTAP